MNLRDAEPGEEREVNDGRGEARDENSADAGWDVGVANPVFPIVMDDPRDGAGGKADCSHARNERGEIADLEGF